MIILILICLGVFTLTYALDYNDKYQLGKPVLIADIIGAVTIFCLFIFATDSTIGHHTRSTTEIKQYYSAEAGRDIFIETEEDYSFGEPIYKFKAIVGYEKTDYLFFETKNPYMKNVKFNYDEKKASITVKEDSLYWLKKLIVGPLTIEEVYYEVNLPSREAEFFYKG